MARKLLILLLVLSMLIELGIACAAIAAPAAALRIFRVGATADSSFLAYTIGWLCLFVSLIYARMLYKVWMRRGNYVATGYLLGFWWIGIGIGIYLAYGRAGNLLLDSLKGLLLVIAVNRSRAAEHCRKPDPGG